MTAPFGRLLTAMVTPMTPAGDVDPEATKVRAKALVASGTEGIVSTGSTGEAATLSEEETVAVGEATKTAVGPGVAVTPGHTYYPNGGGDDRVRLVYSALPPDELREGVRRLGVALEEVAGGPGAK